jgi:hypothetical protein
MRKISKNIVRTTLSLIIGLVLLGFSPSPVKADTNPVDLELGGEGATPWSMADIQPGDSGAKTVELRNTGSKDGFVTIWVDEITSSEGDNPESETGDTAEPGEFADYLLLNLNASGLNTSLNLPTLVNNLPPSASSREYIEIVPLKAGDNINLQWEWELPPETGNEVQGDSLSFTINYLLRECTITDLSGVVDGNGVFQEELTVESDSGQGNLTISQGTTGQTVEGNPLTEIWLIETDREPPPLPEGKAMIGLHYDAGPNGSTFDEPITITLTFDPDDIPEGVSEGYLVIALWDEGTGEWVPLDNCTVDTAHNTVSAQITHFSQYGIIAPCPPPPPPPPPPEPVEPEEDEDEPPATVDEDDEDTDVNLLEICLLDEEFSVEIGEDGTLSHPLLLTDSGGNFVIDIDSGTRLTGSGGALLNRIELRITDRLIAMPDDVVLISPVYELTGYNRDMEITEINLEPPATLTISYDPQDLPENAFLPFVANYTDEHGLVRLQPPPGSLDEIGQAKALISHASLFVVAVELAPPPPPLPARFAASDLSINPQQVNTGQAVTISLTITNEGATAGTYELHLIIDGIVRAIEEVTLSGQSNETLTFKVSNLAAGTHKVKAAGLSGEFRVVKIEVLPEESGVNWLIIDTSVSATLIIGALALYLITRRLRHQSAGH